MMRKKQSNMLVWHLTVPVEAGGKQLLKQKLSIWRKLKLKTIYDHFILTILSLCSSLLLTYFPPRTRGLEATDEPAAVYSKINRYHKKHGQRNL